MGHSANGWDYKKGFKRLEYSGDPAGPSFQEDVAEFETYLKKLGSFKPGNQRPAR